MTDTIGSIQLLASILLVFLAVFLWRDAFRTRRASALAATSVFASLFLLGLYFAADRLGGNGIDEAVVYHLGAGLSGAGLLDFRKLLLLSSAIAIGIAVTTWLAYRTFRAHKSVKAGSSGFWLGSLAMAASLAANPAVNDILSLSQTRLQITRSNTNEQPHIFHELGAIRFGPEKRNIVLLFLESIERSYLDETVFPGLAPRLAELEQEALSFTNIQQVAWTNWTIAGMSAALCGLPLNGFAGNSMSEMERFLPRATCLGDLLSEQGYSLHYLGGASLHFAGKGNFFASHGFDVIEGREELIPHLEDQSYQSYWGLYDDSLYAFAKNKFDDLTDVGDPFALVLLTVDTHHPDGHLSRKCQGRVYGDGTNSLLNSVHCADLMLGEFVDHVRSSSAAEDTILVVASDHLAMPNKAWDKLNSVDRSNLLLFFGSEVPVIQDDRPGSMLDIGPTVLSLAGARTDAFGFGRSLLLDEPTLTESLPDIDASIEANAGFLASFWSFPPLQDGIMIDRDAERLLLGGEYIGYPALMTVDDKLQVEFIRFESYADHSLLERIEHLDHDKRFIWVDRCDRTSQLADVIHGDSSSYCAAIGMLGGPTLHNVKLRDDSALDFRTIERALTSFLPTEKAATERLARAKVLELSGTGELVTFRGRPDLAGHFLLRSAGFGAGESRVTNFNTNSDVVLARGITVMGLNADDAPKKLFHRDTCAWGRQSEDIQNFRPSIDQTLQTFSSYFDGLAVIVDDSAVCDIPVDFAEIFAGTPFHQWDQIEFRRPYIGLLLNDRSVQEFTGPMETALAVELRDVLDPNRSLPAQRQSKTLKRIAHGGGAADGVRYTNSIDALNQNKAHFDFFEIDFVWTSDDRLVCLHDWEGNFRTSFDVDRDGPVSLAEFEALAGNARFRNCTLASLVDWLEGNPTARIVPDVKDRNVQALQRIATVYPHHIDRFIPQIYQPENYLAVRSLGFDDIIWTLYRYYPPDRDQLIPDWLNFMDLFALAMPIETAKSGMAVRAQRETGVLSIVHTVNAPELLDELVALGVVEIMTEELLPQ